MLLRGFVHNFGSRRGGPILDGGKVSGELSASRLEIARVRQGFR